MADREPGFEIKGTFYPQPVTFRLPDTVLIYEATGMKMEEFSTGLDPDSYDERSLVGLVAVAIAHKHRAWSRDKVIEFLNDVNWEDLAPVGMEADADSPPAEPQTEEEEPTKPGLTVLENSSEESSSEPGSTSDLSSRMSSGNQQ